MLLYCFKTYSLVGLAPGEVAFSGSMPILLIRGCSSAPGAPAPVVAVEPEVGSDAALAD